MSEKYVAISWNRQKKIYDALVWSGVIVYLLLFIGLGGFLQPNATIETLIIRGFGTCAILLLHLVLVIGPLCRLSPKFLPLLYNRRHLGVTTFLIGAVHAVFSIIQFHALGTVNPIVSVLVSNTRFNSIADFPFQVLGLMALIILFLMAVTSHDFWLNNLTAPVWKTLHTLVYVAYALLIGHIALGVLQAETSSILTVLLGIGLVLVVGLHLISAFKETSLDKELITNDEFIEACAVAEIPEKRACIRTISGERVAIFKYDGKISAVSNVCQHQNGPLGEGMIGDDGCITCPWHGFQYLPETGASPPPFTEKVPTFNLKVEDGKVFVHPKPNKAGTRVEGMKYEG
ncbi:MAG TPA: ferric reductase-like transmembrane domain-containing protein [Pyrinomonadaceae bacterium]|nr:ferric reductase-like transmembrane domain-containing protein [Pyrinomonadaceae bacterium]